MRWWFLALVGCSDLGNPAGTGEPPKPVATKEPMARPKPPPFKIRWVSVRDTPPCFYFSGPDGRDTKLVGEVIVDRVELGDGDIRLAIAGATFAGTYRDKELAVKRTSDHTFGGSWTATEEIKGKLIDNTFLGTYSYRECEHGNACPGHCTIDAEIRFER